MSGSDESSRLETEEDEDPQAKQARIRREAPPTRSIIRRLEGQAKTLLHEAVTTDMSEREFRARVAKLRKQAESLGRKS